MRSMEDKGSYNQGEVSSGNAITFEFHKSNNGSNRTPHHRMALGKPTPSKWDDAQKWLVGLSRGGGGGGGGGGGERCQNKQRNSNADDRRLITPVPQQEEEYSSGGEDGVVEISKGYHPSMENHYAVETKKVDCDASVWRINKTMQNSAPSAVRSISVRDMGTEMTPIASQEPSRTATPIRVRTPAARSPISSGSSTPARCQHGLQGGTDQGYQAGVPLNNEASSAARGNGSTRRYLGESNGSRVNENGDLDQSGQLNSLEKRAIAWEEAERAKYTARYKREEVKIQAWENHEKRKAEMEMKKMEVKAERMKARAQEKLANKLAKTKRIAEEKRANAAAKLNEKAVKTSESADYIRRNGHLPSSFSFKLPSICW